LTSRTVVLGVGNSLLRDEGAGVYVVRARANDPCMACAVRATDPQGEELAQVKVS